MAVPVGTAVEFEPLLPPNVVATPTVAGVEATADASSEPGS
jgi:hypothetical protein